MTRALPSDNRTRKQQKGRATARRVIFLTLLLILTQSCMGAKGLEVVFGDSRLAQGELALVHLRGPGSAEPISGSFNGGSIIVVKTKKGGAWAIVAADLESKPGPYYIIFREGTKEISTSIRLVSGEFGTDRLTLPSEMVSFTAKTLTRIKREKEKLTALRAVSSPVRLWNGPFVLPLKGRISGAFGQRRILNGEPRSSHGGLDIAAPKGRPVAAAGGGRVAYVGDFFFYGKFVLIDHGLGLFTLYAHLGSVNVKKGDTVTAGRTIGLVGATGRATGPHLHFAVTIGKTRVSPQGFIRVTERLRDLMASASARGRSR